MVNCIRLVDGLRIPFEYIVRFTYKITEIRVHINDSVQQSSVICNNI